MQEIIKLAEECGLIFVGYNEDEDPEFIGDNKAWSEFDKVYN